MASPLPCKKAGTNVIGKTGGDIGYGGLNAVGSVVQTWSNNRAGLNTDGDPYNTQSAPTNLGLANVVLGSETVSYDASTHMLTMTGALDVDGTVYLISDSAAIDLNGRFGPTMFVGFTGGTAGSYADQRITSFSLIGTTVPESRPLALLCIGIAAVVLVRRKQRLIQQTVRF